MGGDLQGRRVWRPGLGLFTWIPSATRWSFASSFVERARLLLTGQWTPIPAEMGLVYAPGSAKALELRVIGFTVIAMLAACLSL